MKTFISAIFILALSSPIFSQTIDIEKAIVLSNNWALAHGINSDVENIIYKTVDKDTLLYIVNYNNAWVMISAGKSLMPILGFSLESTYDVNNEPDALKSLFDFYAYVKKENRANGVEYSAEWEKAASGNLKSEYSSGSVEPLLPVTWNQDWPYNAYCPEDADLSANFNGHHNTSCGPTAFAQVLRYWKYPERGSGSHSFYYEKFGTSISANFGATQYNWDNMPAVLDFGDTESVYKDVANLMVHAAVAVDYSYSSGGTLSQYTSAAVRYFGYSPTCRVLYRDDFSNSGWHSIFRDDLNNGRPIMIMANSAGSAQPWENGNVNGHYFVCDGYYGNDYYHINWGWGGSGNGYFPLFSLGSYVYHNHALIGLEPNYDKKELVLTDPYTTDNNTVVLMHFDGDLNNESSLSENPSQNGSISFEDNSSLGLGQSLYLDNSSQNNQSYLAIPDNDNLDLEGDWTIEMWFKPNSIGNNYGQNFTMISKPGNNGNRNANYSASILPTSAYVDEALSCTFYPSPDIEKNTGIIRTDKDFIKTGQWYHFSFIRNTGDKTMSLVIHDANKKLIHYASDSYHAEKAESPRLNSNPLYIGFGYYTNTFFDGYIDELRISNIAREPRVVSTSVRITEPNGGEKWIPGHYKNIKWHSENVNEIDIEYSIDNGDSWKTVINGCSANRTSWSWEVPEIQSKECLIKITDTSDNSIVDISDGVFTIEEENAKIWQEINLNTGWNILSFNVEPDNKNLLNIVQPLIDAEKLHKIIDEGGNILQHMPWGWVNNIGNMSNTEGYYAKVSSGVTLSIHGTAVQCPFDIDLFIGWNIMGYPCQNPEDAMSVLQVLIDDEKVDKVIDENGNIIQYMPWGWVNNIGDLLPGEGYYIKLSEDASITFEEPGVQTPLKTNDIEYAVSQSKSFAKSFKGNPYMPMTIVLTNLNELLHDSEVGVFDGKTCVGAAVIEDEIVYISASADDPYTPEIDGFTKGSRITIKVFDRANAEVRIVKPVIIQGVNSFAPLETYVGSLKSYTGGHVDSEFHNNYLGLSFPNPASDFTIIEYGLFETSSIILSVYDQLGKRVRKIERPVQLPGVYKYQIDWKNLKNGIYYYRLETTGDSGYFTESKKMVVKKY